MNLKKLFDSASFGREEALWDNLNESWVFVEGLVFQLFNCTWEMTETSWRKAPFYCVPTEDEEFWHTWLGGSPHGLGSLVVYGWHLARTWGFKVASLTFMALCGQLEGWAQHGSFACVSQPLHWVSPIGLLYFLIVAQGSRTSFPAAKSGFSQSLETWAQTLVRCPFCHIVLFKAVTEHVCFRWRGHWAHLSFREELSTCGHL